jgi:hypothetical protein
MSWIRLQSEYPRHRKTLRLIRRLGPVAELYPIRLWLWAVEQSPGGSLRDIDAAELALIVGYAGEPSELWSAMVKAGFIERADGEYRVRSWYEHNGILIDRSERNRERMRRARAQHDVRTCGATDVTNVRTDETDEDSCAPAREGSEDAEHTGAPVTARALQDTSPAGAPAEGDLAAYRNAMCESYPRFRDELAVSRALFELRRLLPPLDEFRESILEQARSPEWLEDGGRYVPKPAKWLLDGGFRNRPLRRAAPLAPAVPKPAPWLEAALATLLNHPGWRLLSDHDHDEAVIAAQCASAAEVEAVVATWLQRCDEAAAAVTATRGAAA